MFRGYVIYLGINVGYFTIYGITYRLCKWLKCYVSLPKKLCMLPKGYVSILYNYVNLPNDYVNYLRCNEGQHRSYIGLE
jgi:hypothetical protein